MPAINIPQGAPLKSSRQDSSDAPCAWQLHNLATAAIGHSNQHIDKYITRYAHTAGRTLHCDVRYVGCNYLSRDPDKEQPLLGGITSVVDDLAAGQAGVTVKHLLGLGFTWWTTCTIGSGRMYYECFSIS